ncbi:MAG: hypothetical protein SFZ02_12430 [bacterium]|nr:hypothetical protein [bacterium]
MFPIRYIVIRTNTRSFTFRTRNPIRFYLLYAVAIIHSKLRGKLKDTDIFAD